MEGLQATRARARYPFPTEQTLDCPCPPPPIHKIMSIADDVFAPGLIKNGEVDAMTPVFGVLIENGEVGEGEIGSHRLLMGWRGRRVCVAPGRWRVASGASQGRKVRTPQGAMPLNLSSRAGYGRRAVFQNAVHGQCHREHTAWSRPVWTERSGSAKAG